MQKNLKREKSQIKKRKKPKSRVKGIKEKDKPGKQRDFHPIINRNKKKLKRLLKISKEEKHDGKRRKKGREKHLGSLKKGKIKSIKISKNGNNKYMN